MSTGRVRKSAGIAAGALLIAAAGLVAGRAAGGVLPGGGGAGGPARHFARIARALDLTDDQKTKIKAVLKTHEAEIEAQLQAGSQARRSLYDAVQSRPPDESLIRNRAADLGRVHGDGAVLLAKIRAEIDPILTDAQKSKIAAFHDKMATRGDRMAHALHAFLEQETN